MSRSPRISECSTATNANFTTTAAPPSSIPTASSVSSTSNASTATSADSAFSQIGRQLSRFLNAITGRGSNETAAAPERVSRPADIPHLGPRAYVYRPSIVRRKNIQKWMFTCQGCNKPITDFDVQEGAAVMALGAAWHRKHIVCVKCGANVGDERRKFVGTKTNRKMALCIDCHMEAENPNCAVCDRQLFENCVQAEGKKMHHLCFTCERCKAPFEDGKYAIIGGKPYDLDCWFFKHYETAFANGQSSMLFDFASPPPTASDSSSSIPAVIEDPPTFQRKTTELCALFDMSAVPGKDKPKDQSGEIIENDMGTVSKLPKEMKATVGPPGAPKTTSAEDSKSNEEIKPPPPMSPPGNRKNFEAERLKDPPVPVFSPATSPKSKGKELKTSTTTTSSVATTATTTSAASTTTATTTGTSTDTVSSSRSGTSIASTSSSSTLKKDTLGATSDTASVASTQPASASVSMASTQDGTSSVSITSDGGTGNIVVKPKDMPLSPPTSGSKSTVMPIYLNYPIIAGLSVVTAPKPVATSLTPVVPAPSGPPPSSDPK